jgi:hypothetical protein
MYLSFHPGFNRNLGANPNLVKLTTWRLLTLVDTVKFITVIRKYAKISLLGFDQSLNLLSIVKKLVQDQKDYVVSF